MELLLVGFSEGRVWRRRIGAEVEFLAKQFVNQFKEIPFTKEFEQKYPEWTMMLLKEQSY